MTNPQFERYVQHQCAMLDIPFFFKQVAAARPTDEMIPDDLRVREYPRVLA